MTAPEWLATVLAEHRQVYTGSKWICWTCREDGPYIYDDDPDGNEAWSAHLAAVVWAEFTISAQQTLEDVAEAICHSPGRLERSREIWLGEADAAIAALLRAMGGKE